VIEWFLLLPITHSNVAHGVVVLGDAKQSNERRRTKSLTISRSKVISVAAEADIRKENANGKRYVLEALWLAAEEEKGKVKKKKKKKKKIKIKKKVFLKAFSPRQESVEAIRHLRPCLLSVVLELLLSSQCVDA
jgi:hypothetical protein